MNGPQDEILVNYSQYGLHYEELHGIMVIQK